ncbi:MAG TPA: hypothetical protein VKU92_01920 [Acidimicrobiales bacterium]|nr:hypothetical protein [Acidimicrobiales bacterium]
MIVITKRRVWRRLLVPQTAHHRRASRPPLCIDSLKGAQQQKAVVVELGQRHADRWCAERARMRIHRPRNADIPAAAIR